MSTLNPVGNGDQGDGNAKVEAGGSADKQKDAKNKLAEAGRRKLEAFRKQKAAGTSKPTDSSTKAPKPASTPESTPPPTPAQQPTTKQDKPLPSLPKVAQAPSAADITGPPVASAAFPKQHALNPPFPAPPNLNQNGKTSHASAEPVSQPATRNLPFASGPLFYTGPPQPPFVPSRPVLDTRPAYHSNGPANQERPSVAMSAVQPLPVAEHSPQKVLPPPTTLTPTPQSVSASNALSSESKPFQSPPSFSSLTVASAGRFNVGPASTSSANDNLTGGSSTQDDVAPFPASPPEEVSTRRQLQFTPSPPPRDPPHKPSSNNSQPTTTSRLSPAAPSNSSASTVASLSRDTGTETASQPPPRADAVVPATSAEVKVAEVREQPAAKASGWWSLVAPPPQPKAPPIPDRVLEKKRNAVGTSSVTKLTGPEEVQPSSAPAKTASLATAEPGPRTSKPTNEPTPKQLDVNLKPTSNLRQTSMQSQGTSATAAPKPASLKLAEPVSDVAPTSTSKQSPAELTSELAQKTLPESIPPAKPRDNPWAPKARELPPPPPKHPNLPRAWQEPQPFRPPALGLQATTTQMVTQTEAKGAVEVKEKPGLDLAGLLATKDRESNGPKASAASVAASGASAGSGAIQTSWGDMAPAKRSGSLRPPPSFMKESAAPRLLPTSERPNGPEEALPVANGSSRKGNVMGNEFGALEQHIEDLTQEKYALQRGMDAARSLSDSLVKENETLTEDFNRQAQAMVALRAEIEQLESEISAQKLVVLSAMQERDAAIGESAGATERAQALAAEVISLEDKIRRMRSRELKLEREMEGVHGEIESVRRQMALMDKDRSSMRTIIDNLQEDKRGLQVRLRKAAVGGALEAVRGAEAPKTIDESTQTDDIPATVPPEPASGLGRYPYHESTPTASSVTIPFEEPTPSSSVYQQPPPGTPEAPARREVADATRAHASTSAPAMDLQLRLSLRGRGGGHPALSDLTSLPAEEQATVESIHQLITAIMEERRAVHAALQAEVAASAELRSANADLSRKLAVQTQRLELAVAQKMVHRPNGADSRTVVGSSSSRVAPDDVPDDAVEYIDENDEVVERVLGWILRLFPGGASKRSAEKRA